MNNNEVNPDNVFKPKKTPLVIGAVLIVLIAAIVVLSVFLISRGAGTPSDTDRTTPAATSDPAMQNPQTSDPADPSSTTGEPDPSDPGITTGDDPSTTPDTGSQNPPQTSNNPGDNTPAITTSERTYNKADPATFSQSMDAQSVNRGAQILVDATHDFKSPSDKLITRTEMNSLSASTLLSEYGFVKVPSSPYFIRKSATLFLNAEACTEFVNMMNAFAAATGNTDVQLRNAYYYDKSEQTCYNATGLFVDLEISKPDAEGINRQYPLNYEKYRSDYYDWFIANCYRFGFIHMWEIKSSTGEDIYSSFRYVGIPHATFMHNNHINDLEAYLNALKAYSIQNVLTYTDDDGVAWQIYYVPKNSSGTTEITLTATPNPNSYSISGNNTDGYIVTINTAYFNGV